MFGGIAAAVTKAKQNEAARLVVAQLRGEGIDIATEADLAVTAGADILMVDIGQIKDFRLVAVASEQGGWRQHVQLALLAVSVSINWWSLRPWGLTLLMWAERFLMLPCFDFSLDVEGEL